MKTLSVIIVALLAILIVGAAIPPAPQSQQWEYAFYYETSDSKTHQSVEIMLDLPHSKVLKGVLPWDVFKAVAQPNDAIDNDGEVIRWMGERGWELAAITDTKVSGCDCRGFYFKRPAKESAAQMTKQR